MTATGSSVTCSGNPYFRVCYRQPPAKNRSSQTSCRWPYQAPSFKLGHLPLLDSALLSLEGRTRTHEPRPLSSVAVTVAALRLREERERCGTKERERDAGTAEEIIIVCLCIYLKQAYGLFVHQGRKHVAPRAAFFGPHADYQRCPDKKQTSIA